MSAVLKFCYVVMRKWHARFRSAYLLGQLILTMFAFAALFWTIRPGIRFGLCEHARWERRVAPIPLLHFRNR